MMVLQHRWRGPIDNRLDDQSANIAGVGNSSFAIREWSHTLDRTFWRGPTQINFLVPPAATSGGLYRTYFATGGRAGIAANATSLGQRYSQRTETAREHLRCYTSCERWHSNVELIRFNAASNGFITTPIDLGPETDQVFFVGFGTGFRHRSSLSAVNATIGGPNAQVMSAGAQGIFVGLDQANVLIPRGLVGRGDVDAILTVDGITANTVSVKIK
jgi:uncharacterized protein (TIGR03437 family)